MPVENDPCGTIEEGKKHMANLKTTTTGLLKGAIIAVIAVFYAPESTVQWLGLAWAALEVVQGYFTQDEG